MELHCEFFSYSSLSHADDQYKCVVTDISRFASNGRVIAVSGEHMGGKSNADVRSLSIFSQPLENFPRYLCNFFPNLKSVSVVACGVKAISRFDFIGFEGVEKLMLNSNAIRTVAADVFEYARGLESISLFDNCIEFIHENAFEELRRLKYLNLKMNRAIDLCVNEFTHVRMSMEQLRGFIRIKFGGRRIDDSVHMNRKLSDTLRFLETFIESSKMLVEDNFNNNGAGSCCSEIVNRN